MTEKERFSAYILEKYNSDVVWHEGNPIKAMDLMLWQAWQAATQREGFKFVPVEATAKMYTEFKEGFDSVGAVNVAARFRNGYKAMIGVIDDH